MSTHPHDLILELSHCPEQKLHTHQCSLPLLPPLSPWQWLTCFLLCGFPHSGSCTYTEPEGGLWHLVLALGMFPAPVHRAPGASASLLFKPEWNSAGTVQPVLFIHLSVMDTGCLHRSPVVNNDAVNVAMHGFVWTPVFSSLGCVPCNLF